MFTRLFRLFQMNNDFLMRTLIEFISDQRKKYTFRCFTVKSDFSDSNSAIQPFKGISFLLFRCRDKNRLLNCVCMKISLFKPYLMSCGRNQ